MNTSNDTFIPRSPETGMFKTKYCDGPTTKTRFFHLSSLHPLLYCLCPHGNPRDFEMPQQFYVSPLDRTVIREKTTSFCVSLLGGGNFF